MIKSPEIYKKDNKGKIRFWFYEVVDDAYSIVTGVVGGKVTRSKPKKCKPKSQKTGELQAFFEAEAARVKKLRIDYHENMKDVNKGPHVFLPMLSFPFTDLRDGELTFPVYAQPKYDGLRSVQHEKGAWSREGKPQLVFDHMLEENKQWRVGTFTFDGEAYGHMHKENFNRIVSLARKTVNITDDILSMVKAELSYYVYDCFVPGMRFEDRLFVLQEIFKEADFEYHKLAETVLCQNMDEVDEFYAEKLLEGFEGVVMRDPDGLYMTDSRPKTSIKRKQFFDSEFRVKALIEGTGNWSGAAKAVSVELPDDKECEVGIDGDYATNAERLREAAEYIEGTATVRFLGWTPDGYLRGGVCKDLVKGERDD